MSRPSRIAIVKELGSRTPRCLAAHAVRADEAELVIVERYPAALGAAVLAVIEEDSKALVPLEHTNIATLISTARLKGDVAILSEWVDGESLATLLASADKPPVEVVLRAFVDVLDALNALHASAASPTGKRVSGPFTPEDVFVGVDGVTRLTRFSLGRVDPSLLGSRRAAYVAPEHRGEAGEASQRSDIFSAGLVLLECLTGEHLPDEGATLPQADVSQRLAARDASVAGLSVVIEKALAIDPLARYATVAEMTSAVTSVGPKVAPRSTVSQYIARVFGERIAARLAKLEPKVDVSLSMSAPSMTEPPPPVEVKPQTPSPVIAPANVRDVEVAPKAEAAQPVEVAQKVEVAKPVEKPSDPKLDKGSDSSPRMQAAAARKGTTPAADVAGASLARKAVPLPKLDFGARKPEPTVQPKQSGVATQSTVQTKTSAAQASGGVATQTTPQTTVATQQSTPQTPDAKVNGNATARHAAETKSVTQSAVKASASKVVDAKPLPPDGDGAPAAPIAAAVDLPIAESTDPPDAGRREHQTSTDPPHAEVAIIGGTGNGPISAREEIDSDIDVVSVRPPPMAKRKKSLPPAAVDGSDAVGTSQARTADNPSADNADAMATESAPPRRSSLGAILFVGLAVIIGTGGFALGRLTSREAPVAPTVDPPPVAVVDAGATTSVATSVSSSFAAAHGLPSEKPSATTSASVKVTSPADSSSVKASSQASPPRGGSTTHYDPGGI